MFAIAFSAHDVLAPSVDPASPTALAAIQEVSRPYPGTLRTLRELEGLGLALFLVGDIPLPLLRRLAQVVWFPGEVVGGPDPLTALVARTGLPASSIWFVSADAREAQRARERGCTVVRVDADAARAADAAAADGVYVAQEIEDLLEIIRGPYTRAALHLRRVIGALLDTPPLDELVL